MDYIWLEIDEDRRAEVMSMMDTFCNEEYNQDMYAKEKITIAREEGIEEGREDERKFFLQLLSDYIHGRDTLDMPSDVDFDRLIALSNAQQLSSVVYYQTHIGAFRPQFAAASYCSVNRKKLIEQIDREFGFSKIDYLIFKGTEVAQYYPHPFLRTSGDVDLLVREEDKEKAGEILEKVGFKPPEQRSFDHEWVYMNGDFEIELHHRLLYDADGLNEAHLTHFTDTVWTHVISTGGVRCHLEAEFHFVYLLLHLRKHFLWAGVGLRQFVDLAMMMCYANLNWEKAKAYIAICDIEKFAAICFALIGHWFGISSPSQTVELSDEFYVKATNRVLAGSVFGDMRRENIVENSVINRVHRQGKVQPILGILFPSYEQMKIKYPGACANDVVGKAMLPMLWIRRMIGSFFRCTAADGLRYAGKHVTADAGKRVEELKAWGLR